jgi:hypothetical protein
MATDPAKNPDEKNPAPKKRSKAEEEARRALEKFREQADQSTHDLFMNARRDQLHRPDLTAEILKGTTIRASVWTYGPGRQHFTVQFEERITAIAKFMNVKRVNQKVAKLQAYFLGDTGLLVIPRAAHRRLSLRNQTLQEWYHFREPLGCTHRPGLCRGAELSGAPPCCLSARGQRTMAGPDG